MFKSIPHGVGHQSTTKTLAATRAQVDMQFMTCYSGLPRELQTALAQDEITPHYCDAEVFPDMYAEYDPIKDTYPHRESWVREASQLTTMPLPQLTYTRDLDKLNTYALSA